jgi:hypothetical protein
MRTSRLLFLLVIPLVCLLTIGIYFLPPVHSRLAWRLDELVLRIKYTFNPPGEAVFVPQQAGTQGVDTALSPTPSSTALPPSPTPAQTDIPPTPGVDSPTPMPTVVPTVTSTPLPESVQLKGVIYEDQHGRLNYCAPANLSWSFVSGLAGERTDDGRPVLKPDQRDKNVMPAEMAWYVEARPTSRWSAAWR